MRSQRSLRSAGERKANTDERNRVQAVSKVISYLQDVDSRIGSIFTSLMDSEVNSQQSRQLAKSCVCVGSSSMLGYVEQYNRRPRTILISGKRFIIQFRRNAKRTNISRTCSMDIHAVCYCKDWPHGILDQGYPHVHAYG